MGQELYFTEHRLSAGMFETGFVGFTLFPLNNHNLPREEEWAWNQSSAKTTVRMDSMEVATFYKLNVRKRRSCLIPPSYKIWIYILEEKYFLWCEKGLAPARTFTLGASTPSTKTPPIYSMRERGNSRCESSVGCVSLKLEDLKFLAPFIAPSVASELGWD